MQRWSRCVLYLAPEGGILNILLGLAALQRIELPAAQVVQAVEQHPHCLRIWCAAAQHVLRHLQEEVDFSGLANSPWKGPQHRTALHNWNH